MYASLSGLAVLYISIKLQFKSALNCVYLDSGLYRSEIVARVGTHDFFLAQSELLSSVFCRVNICPLTFSFNEISS